MQLKKFSGWLLHSFKIASLGERAAFTYKYPFSCKVSAFSGLSWKESSSLLIPTITWKDFQNILMCSKMETLSAGIDVLEKVKTLFNFH